MLKVPESKTAEADAANPEDAKSLAERLKLQQEFLAEVESKLKRSEKDIWFIKNDDHPQKESLSSNTHKRS
ncbi:MAG: hypothetical protein LCH34_14795 [Firmicutes bacterium]|nr:hypothetical protein [Bacillota bacterium]